MRTKTKKAKRRGIPCVQCGERTKIVNGIPTGVAGFEDWGYCPECKGETYRFQDAQDGSVSVEFTEVS